MMWDGGFGSGGWVLGSIMIIVVLALIVVGVVLLVRGLSGRQDHGQMGGEGQSPSGRSAGSGNALQILEERYARGEIDQEEFRRRKKDLLAK